MNALEIVSLVQGLVAILGIIWLAGWRLAKLEVKVDTMWDFQLRRAVSEGLHQGAMTRNSPVEVTEEAKAWMRPVAQELREFYKRLGRRLDERTLTLEIERRYGDRILEEVCIPRGLYQGACLLIAAAVAKEVVRT